MTQIWAFMLLTFWTRLREDIRPTLNVCVSFHMLASGTEEKFENK